MRCRDATLAASTGGEAGDASVTGFGVVVDATGVGLASANAFAARPRGEDALLASTTLGSRDLADACSGKAVSPPRLFAVGVAGSGRTFSCGGGAVETAAAPELPLISASRSLSGASSRGGRLGGGEKSGAFDVRSGACAGISGGGCLSGKRSTAPTARAASTDAAMPVVRAAGCRTDCTGARTHRQISASRRSSSYLARLPRSRSTEYAAVIACARLCALGSGFVSG